METLSVSGLGNTGCKIFYSQYGDQQPANLARRSSQLTQMYAFKKKAFIISFLGFMSTTVQAKDSLENVMARMRPTQAVSIYYQETRSLALLADTWKGSGLLYAAAPGIMLKEQLMPEQEIMGIKGTQLYYYHIDNDQKHQGELDEDDATSYQVAAFKSLLNGNLAYLRARYILDFTTSNSGWRLTLIPQKSSTQTHTAQLIMQGLPEKAANKLEILLDDGDRTEYRLTPAGQGEHVNTKIEQLMTLLDAR